MPNQLLNYRTIYEVTNSRKETKRYLKLKSHPLFDFFNNQTSLNFLNLSRNYDDFIWFAIPDVEKKGLVSLSNKGDILHENIPPQTEYVLQMYNLFFYCAKFNDILGFGIYSNTEIVSLKNFSTSEILELWYEDLPSIELNIPFKKIIRFANTLIIFYGQNLCVYSINGKIEEIFSYCFEDNKSVKAYCLPIMPNTICILIGKEDFYFSTDGRKVEMSLSES